MAAASCGPQRSQAFYLSETRVVGRVIVCSVRSASVALSNRLRLMKAAQKIGQRGPESGGREKSEDFIDSNALRMLRSGRKLVVTFFYWKVSTGMNLLGK